MRSSRTVTAALIAASCAVPVAAESPTRLSLQWAIDTAVAGNRSIAAARSRWAAAVEEVPQAGSLDDPSIYTMFWAVPDDTPNPFAAREVWLGLKQRFPYPGKLALRSGVAGEVANVAKQRSISAEAEVVRQVKQAFYDLYLVAREAEITTRHLELAREFSRIAEAKYTTGIGAQGNVLKAVVEIADLSNQLLILGQRRRTAAARLNALLNREPDAMLGAPEEFALSAVPQTQDELRLAALANRSELRGARAAISGSAVAIDLARREFYPDFMTDFSYWNVRDRGNRWMLMVEAKMPLAFWSKGKHEARLRQAESERRTLEAAQEELEREIAFAVEDAFVRVQVAGQNAELYERVIIPEARQAVQAVQAGYQTDREDFLNLVDSQRALLRFELDYHRARVSHEKSFADLERAVGAELHPDKGGKR